MRNEFQEIEIRLSGGQMTFKFSSSRAIREANQNSGVMYYITTCLPMVYFSHLADSQLALVRSRIWNVLL